ncbi:hypothetical protein ACJ41O_010690 [Fusarium nematophilum]
MAYETVKRNWIKDEIWNPEWDELPGRTWIAVAHDIEDPEQAPRRSLRTARPSQAETQGGQGSSAASDGSQVESHPSARSAEIPKKSGTEGRLDESQGGDVDERISGGQGLNTSEDSSPSKRSVTCPSRQSRRSRSDAAEEMTNLRNDRGITLDTRPSPPKNTADIFNASKESHSSQPVVTKGATPLI